MLAFIHIEKAAGTTLIHLLRSNLCCQYIDVRPLDRRIIASNQLPVFSPHDLEVYLKINPFLKCIGGHSVVPFANLESVVGNIKYFTVLRDPIKRYLSHYTYRVNRLNEKISFDEFLDIEMLHNLQSKKLGNAGSADVALQEISKKSILTGIAEDFDEFLLALQREAFNGRFNARYSIKNIGKSKSSQSLLDKYQDRIYLANSQDIILYEKVRDSLKNKKLTSPSASHDNNEYPVNKKNGILIKSLADYFIRKAYYEPITGLMRLKNGMPYKGSQA